MNILACRDYIYFFFLYSFFSFFLILPQFVLLFTSFATHFIHSQSYCYSDFFFTSCKSLLCFLHIISIDSLPHLYPFCIHCRLLTMATFQSGFVSVVTWEWQRLWISLTGWLKGNRDCGQCCRYSSKTRIVLSCMCAPIKVIFLNT